MTLKEPDILLVLPIVTLCQYFFLQNQKPQATAFQKLKKIH